MAIILSLDGFLISKNYVDDDKKKWYTNKPMINPSSHAAQAHHTGYFRIRFIFQFQSFFIIILNLVIQKHLVFTKIFDQMVVLLLNVTIQLQKQ